MEQNSREGGPSPPAEIMEPDSREWKGAKPVPLEGRGAASTAAPPEDIGAGLETRGHSQCRSRKKGVASGALKTLSPKSTLPCLEIYFWRVTIFMNNNVIYD